MLRAQVRIGDLEQQRLQAQSGVQVALALLGAAMGKPEATPPTVRLAGVFQHRIPTSGELDEWFKKRSGSGPI